MKTKLLLFLLLLFSLISFAKKQHESLSTYGLLWKITGNGLKIPSYLFGTYHALGGMQILDSIKCFDTIFNTTDQLVCEIDIANIFKPQKNNNSHKMVDFLKPWPVIDSTYENLLTNKQKYLLDTVLNSNNYLVFAKQSNLRPIILINYLKYSYKNIQKKPTIEVSKDYKQAKDSIKSVMLDLYLQKLAKKRMMNIVSLESVEDYQNIIDSTYSQIPQISYKTEVDILMYYIENYVTMDSLHKEYAKNMLSAYLTQNISLCLNLVTQKAKDNDPINNPILFYLGNENISERSNSLIYDERNNKWIKKIPDLIAKNSSFIAVGGGHLAGEKGLINQLIKLGYTVIPLHENTK